MKQIDSIYTTPVCSVCGGRIFAGVPSERIAGGLYDGNLCHADVRDCIRQLARDTTGPESPAGF